MNVIRFPKRKILFVSNGGLCRAAMAAGILRRRLLEQGQDQDGPIQVASGAISDIHVGKPPTALAIEAAAARGCDIRDIRVRKVAPQDLDSAEVLATDRIVLSALRNLAPHGFSEKPKLLTRYSGMGLVDIVDPYGGTMNDYRVALDLIEASCEGLFAALARRH